ncbi:MAG: hypothetical protein L6V88_11970 [Anaerotruncus sp.]|nr:MAG: hypothetical protein L6V88_11970 [Anaerotruncus sp.]
MLEEIEDERKRIFFFRLLTKENAAETFVEFDSDTQEKPDFCIFGRRA